MAKRSITTTEINAGAAASMDDIELLLSDLEIEEQDAAEVATDVEEEIELEALEIEEPAAEETPVEATEEDVAAAVSAVAIEEAKAEAYEGVEAGGYEVTEPAAVEAKAEKPKKEKKASGPRMAKTADTLAGEAFVLDTGDNTDDLDALKAAVLGTRPTQKKIAEKFDNVLCAVAAGKRPSVYVMTCFAALSAKGEATGAELTSALQAAGYSIGTSRSQSGQIMTLFNTLKIATRSGNKLTLNPNSTLVMALRALEAAPPAESEEKGE